jgi:hypothetical protein
MIAGVNTLEAVSAKPLCFVVGPIGEIGSATRKHADLLLNLIVRPAVEAVGYRVKRADDDPTPGMITDSIIRDIRDAKLVVADLSELNPNAFYELGIRHARAAATIHVAVAGLRLPFDNSGYRAIRFDLGDYHSIEQARRDLEAAVRATEAPDFKPSNPITHANAVFELREQKDPEAAVLAEVLDRLSLLESRTNNLETNIPSPPLSSLGLRDPAQGMYSVRPSRRAQNVLRLVPALKSAIEQANPANWNAIVNPVVTTLHAMGAEVVGYGQLDDGSVIFHTTGNSDYTIQVAKYPPSADDIAIRWHRRTE